MNIFDFVLNMYYSFVKPLVCGHAVILCEDASGQPGEEQTAG